MAFPPATAGLRRSLKSFPRDWWHAGIALPFTVASHTLSPVIEVSGWRFYHLGTWRHKYFDTVVHTFLSTLHLMVHGADVALYCNGANAIFTLLPRAVGIPTLLNVDGLEQAQSAKKWVMRLQRAGTRFRSGWQRFVHHSVVITDALQIEAYYLEPGYGMGTKFIPYGAGHG